MKITSVSALKASMSLMSVCIVLVLALVACSSNDHNPENKPAGNPYLASSLYAITHFDSSQSDSTPYGPPRGVFTIDPAMAPICYGGPVNIMTLASTDPDYMWAVGNDRVSYVYKGEGKWSEVKGARFEGLADATDKVFPPVPDDNFRLFGESTGAKEMNAASMDAYLKSLLGDSYSSRFGHGTYVMVDKDNVVYTNYGNTLYGLTLKDPDNPSAGIDIRYKLENLVDKIQGNDPSPPEGTRIFGLTMTYDGNIIVAFSNGVAVIDRNLNVESKFFYRFGDTETVTNSIAVDEQNGIYVAVASSKGEDKSLMRKLIWTGTEISDKESDGAWSSFYDTSGTELPPIIKWGNGTGSTPTLMGFGSDPDKLVVITDGAKQMKLVAFWRDSIPAGFVQKPGTASRRIAGQIDVTCGLSPLPEWIQSEQSVVVSGYGAFVVNNIPADTDTVSGDIPKENKILGVALIGPAYDAPYGVERFEWDMSSQEWVSRWDRSDVSSTSMIPVHSESGNMALINGYSSENGWEVLGFDWNSGETVHRTIFGDKNFGNGAYAVLQYLENQDLLFNSFSGPIRIHYDN